MIAALAAILPAIAQAQGLPRLTVTALSMTTERTTVAAGQTFHVRIHLHTAQRVPDLSSLVLPNVENLTILGDEKRTTPVAGDGTDYVEILSLAATSPGAATLSPAYIDARDPTRGERPFRFSSNALTINVTAEAFAPSYDAVRPIAAVVLRVAAAVAVLAGIIFAVSVMVQQAARRRRAYVRLPTARPVEPPAPPRPIDRAAPVRTAAARMSAVRSRANAASLRAALFAYAGARSEETLATLLERIDAGQTALRASLRAAERATFVDEANLQGAIEDLLDAMRRMGFL